MLARALPVVLTVFWVTMNVLLWRAEYGTRPGVGSKIPAHVVWEKILTAPDSSSLTIYRSGKRIGFCHWITSVGEDLAKLSAGAPPPEGMVRRIVSYRLELDGNVMVGGAADRLRFETHLNLGPDQTWSEVDVRLTLRPSTWEARSRSTDQTVRLSWQDDTGKFDRVFKFSDLENPEALFRELDLPFAAGLLGGLGLSGAAREAAPAKPVLNWEARHESVKLGHSSVRTYRLRARLLDRFSIVVFVSRVGEILRVELPGEIVLANDQLAGN